MGYPILEIKLAMLEFGRKTIWVFNLGLVNPGPELVECQGSVMIWSFSQPCIVLNKRERVYDFRDIHHLSVKGI